MKKRYGSAILIGIVIGVLIAVSGYRQTDGSLTIASAVIVQPRAESVSGQDRTLGPVRNVRFTLFDAGIRPDEMRIKAGLVKISIEDKTYVSQGVTIQRIVGSERVTIGAVEKSADYSRGRSSFSLPPGEYELHDASKPTNKALLLVEP